MKNKYCFFCFLLISVVVQKIQAQSVEVSADYNSVGDCIFIAHNNFKTPIFLNIDFADLENTFFPETLPYVKKLDPGFNSLFTLERDLNADVPRFNYDIKSFKSNPMAEVDLSFPYLIPFAPNKTARVFTVENLDGFWGNKEFKSWSASGFICSPGEKIYACRQGIIVEITGAQKKGNPQSWYNTYTYSITLLQPDGTLICYKNISDPTDKLELNQKIQAGEFLGEISSGSKNLIVVIYHNTINSDDFLFVIPEFVVEENKTTLLISTESYQVVHPDSVRGLEMTNREKRKYLK